MKRLLLIVCLLLAYGSLHPWKWKAVPDSVSALDLLWRRFPPDPFGSSLRDLIVNVAIYVPVGFFAFLAMPRRKWMRIMAPCLVGFSLSYTIELLQRYISTRVPSTLDIATNTFGTAAGVLVGGGFDWIVQHQVRSLAEARALFNHVKFSSALLLSLIWIAYQAFPQGVRTHGWRDRLRVLLNGKLNFDEICVGALFWTAAGILVAHLFRRRRNGAAVTAFLMAALLPYTAVAPGHALTLNSIAGAVCGFLAVLVCLWLKYPSWLTGAVFPLLLLADGLRPYTFQSSANPLLPIPFYDLLNDNWQHGISVILRKSFLYGSGFWLLERAGAPQRNAWAIALTLVLAVELAQMYLPGRVASLTDPVLAAIVCSALLAVERFGLSPAVPLWSRKSG
jgi:VanZ family protein